MHVFEYKKNNLSVSYKDDFVWDDKYKIKLQVGIDERNLDEGIWALIHPSNYNEYQKDNIYDTNYNKVALLLNPSIYGVEWGSPIPYKMNGSGRPISVLTDYSDGPSELHDVLTKMNIIDKDKV